MAEVAFGLPVYNGEDYLAAALTSLQEQDLADIEIVISDNASTDATEEIARRAAVEDSRVRYVRHSRNRGGAWNYNAAVMLTHAPLFSWMAADDVKLPGFARECRDALIDAGPESVFSCCRTRLIDADGAIIEDLNDTALEVDAPTPHGRLRGLYRSQASHLQYGVIRREALLRTRGVMAVYGDDMILLTELLCLGRMALAPGQHFLQRRHAAQFSQQGAGQVLWHDPEARLRWAFPQFRLNAHLYAAVGRAGLGVAEAARCQVAIARYWAVPRWRGMARDVATALGVASR